MRDSTEEFIDFLSSLPTVSRAECDTTGIKVVAAKGNLRISRFSDGSSVQFTGVLPNGMETRFLNGGGTLVRIRLAEQNQVYFVLVYKKEISRVIAQAVSQLGFYERNYPDFFR